MKKYIAIIVSLVFAISLVGCNNSDFNTITDNITETVTEAIKAETVTSAKLVKIGRLSSLQFLYYDSSTGIVYLHWGHGISPYFAPNGLPYKYDAENQCLVETSPQTIQNSGEILDELYAY